MFTIRHGRSCCFFAKRSWLVARFYWPPPTCSWAGCIHCTDVRKRAPEDPEHYSSHVASILLLRPLRAATNIRTVGDLLSPVAGSKRSLFFFSRGGLVYVYPDIYIGPHVFTLGIALLAIVLVSWRSAYEWIIGLSALCERVYVLGNGERAQTVIETLRTRRDAGMEVVGGAGEGYFSGDLERFEADLRSFCEPKPRIDRVIVAMENRRGSMPVRELLDLRLRGVGD